MWVIVEVNDWPGLICDLNLGHDYGNDCDFDHMQDIDTSNGHDGDECWKVKFVFVLANIQSYSVIFSHSHIQSNSIIFGHIPSYSVKFSHIQ